jgi:hypothetical protein
MIVDEAGALWLSNPWIAMLTLAAAVALVVWCHRWLETGEAPMPKSVAVRGRGRRRTGRPQALRTNRVGSHSMSAPLLHFSRTSHAQHSDGVPRSAA